MATAADAPVRSRKPARVSIVQPGKRKYPKTRPSELQLSRFASEDSIASLLTPSSSGDTLPEHTSPTSPKFHRSQSFLRSFTSHVLSRNDLHSLRTSRAFWISLWFSLNFSLTLSNKFVLNRVPLPYSITALHALGGCVGTWFALQPADRLPTLTSREVIVLVAFSTLYTVNIVVSNVSLQLVTVPFHQVVRSSAPFFTLLLSGLLLHRRITRLKLVSLIPVVLGVGLATYGDYYYTLSGFLLTLLGTFLASLKAVVTNILQSSHSHSHHNFASPPTSPSSSHVLLQEDKDTSPSHSHSPNQHYPQVRTSKGHERSSSISITVTVPPSHTPLTHTPSRSHSHSQLSSFLSSVPKLHLTPVQLLHLLSPLALFQCTLLALYFNEHTKLVSYLSSSFVSSDLLLNDSLSRSSMSTNHINGNKPLNANETVVAGPMDGWSMFGSAFPTITLVAMNIFMAFALNVVSFETNRKVGALGMSVAANVKQVLTILSSVVLFNITITGTNALGILLTLIGGAWYASVDLKERERRLRRI